MHAHRVEIGIGLMAFRSMAPRHRWAIVVAGLRLLQ